MEIFIIVIAFLIIWFFTSKSKSEDVKTAFKSIKKIEREVHEFLDVLDENLDELNKKLEDSKIKLEEKQRIRKEETYIAERRELAKRLSGLDENTEESRLDGITIEWSAEEKLVKVFDRSEYLNNYIQEIDSYLIDFLKIRFYLSGKTSYPDLQCIAQYFSFKFSDLDKSCYSSIWQDIVNATVFDSSKCKNIDAIYHFTHKSNLSSILEYGILTRTNLNNMKLRYEFNDQMRLDGVLDSISLSFSHPNFKMFYKYRKQTGEDD